MIDSEPPISNEEKLKSTGLVTGLLPKLAGLLTGLTALALYAGWRESNSYFSAIGAPWAGQMLSPTRLIQTSIGFISTIGLLVLFSVYAILEGAATGVKLRRWSIVWMFIAVTLFIASLVLTDRIGVSTRYLLSVLASLSTAICAGLTIGEVIARLSESRLKWQAYHVWLLYWVLGYALLQIPSHVGTAKAQLDADETYSDLPHVKLVTPQDGKAYRLVTSIDGLLLLMTLEPNRSARTFRLVPANEVSEVGASRSNNPAKKA